MDSIKYDLSNMDITSWALLFSIILNVVTIASIIVDIVSSNEKKTAIQRNFLVIAAISAILISLSGIFLSVLNAESLGFWYPLFISIFVGLLVFLTLMLFFWHYLKQIRKVHENTLEVIQKITDRLS